MGLTERHWFEDEDVPENYEWALEDAVYNSRANKKAPEAAGWVSTNDRLPEINNPVIVYARGKNDPIFKIVITSMTNKNIFNTRLETEPYWREPWQFFDTMYEITHWMPLPEPPMQMEHPEYGVINDEKSNGTKA